MAVLAAIARWARRRPVATAMLGVALLYLAAVNARWTPTSDSALYLGIGRNLAAGRGYTFLGRPQTRTEPLVPLLGAANYRLLGDRYLALNLLYSAMAVAAAGMVYLLARQAGPVFDEGATRRGGGSELGMRSAERGIPNFEIVPGIQHPTSSIQPWAIPLACCLSLALSWRLYLDATRILTDVPFTLLGLCGFWAAGRIAARPAGGGGRDAPRAWAALAWSLAAWGLLLAAALTRLIGLTFLAALALALVLPGGRVGGRPMPFRRRAVALLPAVLVAVALIGWFVHATRQPGPLSPAFYRFKELPPLFWDYYAPRMAPAAWELPAAALETFWGQHLPLAGFVVAAVMVIGMAGLVRRRQWLMLTPVWLYLPPLVVLGPEAVQARYLLPLAGWLAIWFFAGLRMLGRMIFRRAAAGEADDPEVQPPATTKRGPPGSGLGGPASSGPPRRGAEILLWAGLAVLVVPAVPRIARQAFYAHHPDYQRVIDHRKWAGYFAAADWLRAHTEPGTRVFTDEPRVVHFLSGRFCTDRPERVAQQAGVRPARWPDYAVEARCDYVLVALGRDEAAEGARRLAADPRFRPVHGRLGPDEDPASRKLRGRFLVFQRVAPPV